MWWVFQLFLVLFCLSVGLNIAMSFAGSRGGKKATPGEILWTENSKWFVIAFLLLLLLRIGPTFFNEVHITLTQPQWKEWVELHDNPPPPEELKDVDWTDTGKTLLQLAEEAGVDKSEAPEWRQRLDSIERDLRVHYPKFKAHRAYTTVRFLRFIIPPIFWLLVVYGVRLAMVQNGRGKREALAFFQIFLLACVVFLLLGNRFGQALPDFMRMGIPVAAWCFGFGSPPAMALLAVILSIVALGLNYSVGSWLTRMVALAFLLLSFVNLAGGYVFPSWFNREIKGEWGNNYGVPLQLASIQEESPKPTALTGWSKSYIISFDTQEPGPHPTNLTIKTGQRLVIERLRDEEKPYKYWGYKTMTGGERWVSVAGDTLVGRPLYPQQPQWTFPRWFHTRDCPAGALIVRIGNGHWFAPLVKSDYFVGTNVSGPIIVDINDTAFRDDDDGLQHLLDNQGTVVFRLRIEEPKGAQFFQQ